jgi:hypothetical protein
MSKHTPGPWRMIGEVAHGKVAAWVLAADPTSSSFRELQVISMIDSHCDKEYLDRRYADMKLIAAAPELLQALEAILELGRKDNSNPKYDQYYENAKNAIQSATNQ